MRDGLAGPCGTHRVAGGLPAGRPARWLTCALATLGSVPLHAQDAAGARALSLQPRLSITETLSNNIELSPTQPLTDALTEVTAGVGFRSNSGRVTGFLDYALTGYVYARNSDLNTYQNALNANLGGELIENRARLDVVGGITQSSLSAFGVQPGSSGLPTSNLTEYRSFSITPSLYGPLGPAAKYKAGLTYSISDARGTTVGDLTDDYAFVQFSPQTQGVVGWAVDMNSRHAKYVSGRDTVDNRLVGTLNRRIDTLDLLVNLSAGVEITDISTIERARYQNWGIGATWEPSPRTKLQAQFDERFFGNAHNVAFEHRTALTTWRISDTRSLNTGGNGTTPGGQGATFDLYYAQFASIEPDPAKRTALVNEFLKANGLSPTTGNATGYVRSGETVTRSQNASVAYRGLRGTAVLQVGRTVDVPVDGAPLPGDDFVNTTNVVTESVSLSLSHQLTPLSSANLLVSYQQSSGDQPQQHSSQREVNLRYLTQINDRSNLVVGVRRAVYKTYQSPYNESALFATFGVRF